MWRTRSLELTQVQFSCMQGPLVGENTWREGRHHKSVKLKIVGLNVLSERDKGKEKRKERKREREHNLWERGGGKMELETGRTRGRAHVETPGSWPFRTLYSGEHTNTVALLCFLTRRDEGGKERERGLLGRT